MPEGLRKGKGKGKGEGGGGREGVSRLGT